MSISISIFACVLCVCVRVCVFVCLFVFVCVCVCCVRCVHLPPRALITSDVILTLCDWLNKFMGLFPIQFLYNYEWMGMTLVTQRAMDTRQRRQN